VLELRTWTVLIDADHCTHHRDRGVPGGKDVYCEKPLSLTIASPRDGARGRGTARVSDGSQRSGAEFRQACELVRNGYIGDVQTVHVEIDLLAPVELRRAGRGFDYERWLGPRRGRRTAAARRSYYDDAGGASATTGGR